MSMRPDQYTFSRIEDLIRAAADHDNDRAGEVVVELVESDHDAYLLMMTLAHQAARLAHAMTHLLDARVQAVTAGEPPPTQTAVQIIAHVANDEHGRAAQMAVAATGDVAYAQHVLLTLAFLAGQHEQHVHVVTIHDAEPEDRRN